MIFITTPSNRWSWTHWSYISPCSKWATSIDLLLFICAIHFWKSIRFLHSKFFYFEIVWYFWSPAHCWMDAFCSWTKGCSITIYTSCHTMFTHYALSTETPWLWYLSSFISDAYFLKTLWIFFLINQVFFNLA